MAAEVVAIGDSQSRASVERSVLKKPVAMKARTSPNKRERSPLSNDNERMRMNENEPKIKCGALRPACGMWAPIIPPLKESTASGNEGADDLLSRLKEPLNTATVPASDMVKALKST